MARTPGTVFEGTPPHKVTVDGTPLDPRLDLRNSSPTGFSWGYGGSGPAQLSLAILAAVTSDSEALKFHQQFKWSCVAHIPKNSGWQMTVRDVDQWLQRARKTDPSDRVPLSPKLI